MSAAPWALAAPLFLSSCIVSAVYRDSVNDEFVASNYCPASRVELVERPDLHLPPRLHERPITGHEPVPEQLANNPVAAAAWEQRAEKIRAQDAAPPGIAADPERLAVWDAQVEASHRSDLRAQGLYDRAWQGAILYEASGCGVKQVFACGAMLSKRPCSPVKLPNASGM